MESWHSILFEGNSCAIKDETTKETIIEVKMTTNKLFSLQISVVKERVMMIKELNHFELWYLRYKHLNINDLRLLNQKQMVYNLFEVNKI